jgi:hypothetical protein
LNEWTNSADPVLAFSHIRQENGRLTKSIQFIDFALDRKVGNEVEIVLGFNFWLKIKIDWICESKFTFCNNKIIRVLNFWICSNLKRNHIQLHVVLSAERIVQVADFLTVG